LRIGSDTAVAPELNSPRYRIVFLFCAAVRALDETWPASHLPSAGVASSSETYLMVYLPTFPPARSRASFSPLTTSVDCLRSVGSNGSDEYTVSVLPDTHAPPPPLEPLLPQAASVISDAATPAQVSSRPGFAMAGKLAQADSRHHSVF
jgi:hypothetical protein